VVVRLKWTRGSSRGGHERDRRTRAPGAGTARWSSAPTSTRSRRGPGINDNGFGSGGHPRVWPSDGRAQDPTAHRVRFAFWGAEEFGLFGSDHYVGSLSKPALTTSPSTYNFDMLGSPHYARFVYDGDGSATPDSGRSGAVNASSPAISPRAAWRRNPRAFDGRSDYLPFIAAGIPAAACSPRRGHQDRARGGVYGGVTGLAYDPCYHAACDTLNEADQSRTCGGSRDAYGERTVVGNVNRQALDEMADGAAPRHAGLRPDDLGGPRPREGGRHPRLRAGVQGAVRGALGRNRRVPPTGRQGAALSPSPAASGRLRGLAGPPFPGHAVEGRPARAEDRVVPRRGRRAGLPGPGPGSAAPLARNDCHPDSAVAACPGREGLT
jgi:hypothetical protein